MHLSRVQITNFRNFKQIDVTLDRDVVKGGKADGGDDKAPEYQCAILADLALRKIDQQYAPFIHH